MILIGLNFWKAGSRKLYAVPASSLHSSKVSVKRKISNVNIDSDSDDDSPPPKRTSAILNELKNLRSSVDSVLKLTTATKIPAALHILLQDTFKCMICHESPIVPPVIMTKCCKVILGCQQCVDTWFGGESGRKKQCPHCKHERAFTETARLYGVDDFLDGIRPLINMEDDQRDHFPGQHVPQRDIDESDDELPPAFIIN